LEQKKEFNWLGWLGTLVHAALDSFFRPLQELWMTEKKVTVGEIDGVEITGHLDLFDMEDNTSVDYKVVGDRKLDKVRFSGEPGLDYRVQGHLYGRGLSSLGHKVDYVAVFFLPRNIWIKKSKELATRGFWWAEKYDEQIAIDALERADKLAQHIRMLGADFVLPTLDKMDGCFDCDRWKVEIA
jgi:hypothetical protein